MRSKLKDSFWSQVADRFSERSALERLEGQIAKQRQAIAMASRILSLRNMPGFKDFQQALADMRDHAIRDLSSTTSSNDWMRVLQGQVQAYDGLLSIMEKGEAKVEVLERRLEELQNEKALLERPQNQKAEATS